MIVRTGLSLQQKGIPILGRISKLIFASIFILGFSQVHLQSENRHQRPSGYPRRRMRNVGLGFGRTW